MKNHVELEPVVKGKIPSKSLVAVNVRSGNVLISSPELTAMDLLLYPHRAGGLNNIATILSDLEDSLDFSKVNAEFFDGVPAAVVQRLGYLLEVSLDETEISGTLYAKAKDAGLSFRKTLLKPGGKNAGQDYGFNEKWKVIVNVKIEVDI